MIKALEWDSNFFGLNTGKLDAVNLSGDELVSALSTAKNSDFKLVYIFASHHDETIKKKILMSGAKLTDEKVTYTMNVSEFNPILSENICSRIGSELNTEFESLAFEAGQYSRFRTDEQIPRKKFEELYSLWMKNSLNGTFAKEVFTWEEEGKKLGMVSLGIRNGEGWIGLIAVNEAYRGKSIGKHLIHSVIDWFRKNKIEILNVQTQLENKSSCAFYEKVGFNIKGIEDVYHLWKK